MVKLELRFEANIIAVRKSMMRKTLIIAEAGVNHNGNIDIAKKMIKVAKEAGADIIKFQTANLDSLVSKNAPMAQYQKMNTGMSVSQKEMLRSLVLKYSEFEELARFSAEVGIEFLSTPFDIESIHFLNDIVKIWKIPSGEVTNLPYLVEIAKTKKKVILSTGMCEEIEVERAMDILYNNGSKDITLLHCTTQYPTCCSDVNLLAMKTLEERFGVSVGYSDHTQGIEIAIAAVALGAKVIEKHFTLDKNMVGPDHKASIEPNELAQMIKAIRNVEIAMGDGIKRPQMSENDNRIVARKSIVAAKKIKKGELFTADNIAVKRPGNGISPMKWYDVLGTEAKYDFEEDEMIRL